MLKKSLFISLVVIFCVLLIFKWGKSLSNDNDVIIGILQAATHPALDQAREGFIEEMNLLSQDKVKFVIQNAEGSLSQAQTIAKSFHVHKKIRAIYAIGTSSVQAAVREEKKKPILIAAVSSPSTLGVIYPDSNVSGTSDKVNIEAQVALIKSLTAQVKTVGILFNNAEHNSQIMVREMQSELIRVGLQYVIIGINTENEISQAIASVARKCDAILLPTDNLMAGAIKLISKEALKHRLFLFASDITLVQKGAFAAQGADYFDLGKKSAEIAYEIIILGKRPQDIPIVDPKSSEVVVNKDMVKLWNIDIPEELKGRITMMEEERNGK